MGVIEFEKEPTNKYKPQPEEVMELKPIPFPKEEPFTRKEIIALIQDRNRDITNKASILSGDFRSQNKEWRLRADGVAEVGRLQFTRQVVMTNFESFAGWTQANTETASQTNAFGGSSLQTGTTTNSKSDLNAVVAGVSANIIVWDTKNPFFQATLAVSATTAQVVYFGAGDLNAGDDTEEGFGFKITDGVLSALATDESGGTSTETLKTISGITLTEMNIYVAKMKSKDPHKRIDFYVNGKRRATINSGQPSGNSATLMSFSIKNTTTADKKLYLRQASFIQDK